MRTKEDLQKEYTEFEKKVATLSRPHDKIAGELEACKKSLNEEEITFALAKTSGDEQAAQRSKGRIHQLESQIDDLERLLRGFRAGGLKALLRDQEDRTILDNAKKIHEDAFSAAMELKQEHVRLIEAAETAKQAYLDAIGKLGETTRDICDLASLVFLSRGWIPETERLSAASLRPQPLRAMPNRDVSGQRSRSLFERLTTSEEEFIRAFGSEGSWSHF